MPTYHNPKLSKFDFGLIRSPGPGLGNLMFPLARAILNSKKSGDVMIYPTWPQLKIGPLIRLESDTRIYTNIFKWRDIPGWINWLKVRFLPKVSEFQLFEKRKSVDSYVVYYEGLGNYFKDISYGREIIKDWIFSNAKKKGEIKKSYDIACHIRLGDFGTQENLKNKPGHVVRQSWDWYRKALDEAIKLSKVSSPTIYIFTDELPSKIIKKLNLPYEIKVDPSKNAITAIINMSRAKITVTSRSTFSQWAVFIGNGLAIWSKSFNLSETFDIRPDKDIFL
jgi:hypothetical protein